MDEKQQFYTIIIRHDSSTKWAVNNPILAYGEYAVEDDTHRVKRGDGETAWNNLPYEDFGLSYIVTYANLNGDVSDNPQLVEELNKKLSVDVLSDTNYKVISDIEIIEDDNAIGKITKLTKNVDTGVIDTNIVYIKSLDRSLQGYWSIDNSGAKILNLSAKISIEDYKPGQKYYKDYVCYYKNRLYRAIEDFEAERDFNPNHWTSLSSKYADELLYSNLSSGLSSENVQDAIDETNRRIDNRVQKTDEINRVYGTSNNGTQVTIPIVDLSTVGSVNNKHPDAQKNIQIDAGSINYDDLRVDKGTIKDVLDSKLSKDFAGTDGLLVKNVQFGYNQNTGYIEIIEDKISPLDGNTTRTRYDINVVSEEELNGQVLALNNSIRTTELTLDNRINTEVSTLNGRIAEEVTTLNGTIDSNYEFLNNKIVEEKADILNTIDTKDANMDNKKIDKDLSTTLVSGIDLIPHNSQPTIRITNKNTTTKETTLNYIHIMANGSITARLEDADHIIIDSSSIDVLDEQQNSRITTAESRLNANDTNIVTLMEHDVNHDSMLLLHSQQIAHHETRILALENGLDTANSNLGLEVSNRIAEDTALSGRITENAINITSKVDKSFANILNNKILGKIESDELVNTDILNLKETFISPYDGSLSTTNIKLVSSNGTIVAERLLDGSINLTANVNLDVNYYVTSDTISTTIGDTTEISISSLTPSGRELHAGRDVISDRNNTYGRIQSVDTVAGTCIVLTFQVTTQTVWGGIGGTLTNQTDLVNALNVKIDSVNGKTTTAQSRAIIIDATDINVDETAETKITIKSKLDDLDTNKVTITLDANKIYGTDSQGVATTYGLADLRNIETVNGVSPDNNKEVTVGTSNIASSNIAGTTTTLDAVITELQTEVGKLTSDLQGQIKAYAVGTQYTASGNYTSQNYVTLYNGVNLLMAKVLRNFTSDDTEPTILDSFIYDVEHDNLLLVGIPEEIAND